MPIIFIIFGFIVTLACIAIWLFLNPEFDIYSQHHLKTDQKIIALTFDDGPDPQSTPKILDVLKEYDIQATFFVVGKNVKKYPELLKKTVEAGHLIGNHSYNHSYIRALGPLLLLSDIKATNERIYDQTKLKPIFYRPPYGFRTPWAVKAASQAGYKIITWNNMTYDYFGISTKNLVNNIVRHAHPGGIIVLHDGHEGLARGEFNNLLVALPIIIDNLKKEGYSFVSLDQLLATPGYKE